MPASRAGIPWPKLLSAAKRLPGVGRIVNTVTSGIRAASALTGGPTAALPVAASSAPVAASSAAGTAATAASTAATSATAATGATTAAAVPVATGAASGAAASAGGAASAAGPLSGIIAAAGPVSIAFAAVAAAGVLAAVGVKKLIDTFRAQTDRLAGFSGEVSAAQARTEIRQLQTTMNRAERIGPDVAKWEDRGSKLESAADNLGTELLAILSKIAEPMGEMMNLATTGIDIMTYFVKSSWDTFAGPIVATASVVSETVRSINKGISFIASWFGKKQAEEEEDTQDPFTKSFFAAAAQWNPQTTSAPPASKSRLPTMNTEGDLVGVEDAFQSETDTLVGG
jgi:hypothetical protein